MKTTLTRRARALDPGLAAAAALALIAAWPFLARPSLPQFTDAEMHVYRAAELLLSLREGILWPRWAPDFYYGYGYPVFNYYSPLTYHLAAYYALATGTDVVAGTKAVLVIAIGLGALGVYGFVRDRWGWLAGVVASAAFTFSPYLLYIDPHARGDSPERFALGLAPAMFWAFDRLYHSGRPAALAAAALALAGLILSHPLMAVVFVSLLVTWLLWVILIVPLVPERDPVSTGRAGRAALTALAMALGLGLAALYWLPVLLERYAVQLGNVAGPGYFDFHKYFLVWSELAAPPRTFDLGATDPAFYFSLGWPQVFLALCGALTVFAPRLRRIDLSFFVFGALGFTYLMTRASLQVWESIPQMSYFQFPTRFLGPAAFAVAVLSGAALRWLDLPALAVARRLGWHTGWTQSLAASALTAGCLLGALPLTYPRDWGAFGPVTLERMIGVELEGRALGTTSAGDFLPAGVLKVSDPRPAFLDTYHDERINKVNLISIAETARVEVRDHGPTHDRFFIRAAEPFLLPLFTFYFPGWRAYVDGREVPIEVSVPEGFITFWVPSGPHDVEVRFEDTPPRRYGYAVSGLSLAALAAMTVWIRRRAPRRVAGVTASPAAAPGAALVLAAVLVVFAGFKAAADRAGWFRVTSAGNVVLVAEQTQFARLGSDFALLGFALPRRSARPGDEVPVTLYWKALAPVQRNYQVYVHLFGPDGRLWGQSDKLNPADFPTSRWPTDRYVRDEHQARLTPGAPPGVYTLVVGLWDAASGTRLPAYDASNTPIGTGVVLSRAIVVGQ